MKKISSGFSNAFVSISNKTFEDKLFLSILSEFNTMNRFLKIFSSDEKWGQTDFNLLLKFSNLLFVEFKYEPVLEAGIVSQFLLKTNRLFCLIIQVGALFFIFLHTCRITNSLEYFSHHISLWLSVILIFSQPISRLKERSTWSIFSNVSCAFFVKHCRLCI